MNLFQKNNNKESICKQYPGRHECTNTVSFNNRKIGQENKNKVINKVNLQKNIITGISPRNNNKESICKQYPGRHECSDYKVWTEYL